MLRLALLVEVVLASSGRSLLALKLRGGKKVWDASTALRQHKAHKKVVSVLEKQKAVTKSSSGEALDIPTNAPAVDVDLHVASFGWDHAEQECRADGRRLCKLTEYCPSGKPIGGASQGDVWAPVGDERGNYVQLGNFMRERICKTHKDCCGGIPGWSQSGQVGAKARCCGKPDVEVFKKFQKEMASVQPHREAKVILTDPTQVLAAMRYWDKPTITKEQLQKIFPTAPGKYLTFEVDTGGFNNIRMAFEAMVIYAAVTGRTLVIPPPSQWYLINFGPIKLGKAKGQTSTYKMFFEMKDLCKLIRCITAEEYEKLKGKGKAPPSDQGYRTYYNWLRKNAALGFEDNHKALMYYPSVQAVEKSSAKYGYDFIANRHKFFNSPKYTSKEVLHFPSGDYHNRRFLGQVAAQVAFSDAAMTTAIHRLLRDGVHYNAHIYDVASKVVARLGMFGYSSLHIRRNELQYKDVFIPISRVEKNLRALFKPGEKLYIATDNTSPGFLKPFYDHYDVYRWNDFLTEKGGNVLKGLEIEPGNLGQMEQVVMAAGRVFVGTDFSTFSGLVPRLHGYMGAPDTQLYLNTKRFFHPTNDKVPLTGWDYFHENPVLFTDL